jgi:N-acylneuraminate cytidylyltransferase
MVALIPARAGSKRILAKNVRRLEGHPLLAYTIAAAVQSRVFDAVVVSTDSEDYARAAQHYGAEVPFLRPAELSGDVSPDIEWVEHALGKLAELGRRYDCFSILRPTNPCRKPETIQRAARMFFEDRALDSLRAVEKCAQHPGKMWIVRGGRMLPLLPLGPSVLPWHSTPYQGLPEVWTQNASLEMAWSRVVFEGRTIAGEVVRPFFTQGDEGLDLNTPEDWVICEHKLRIGEASLPAIAEPEWQPPESNTRST